MFRLLYLCVHPRNSSPSQRYRFEQFEPYLQEQDVEVEYSPALTTSDLAAFSGTASIQAKTSLALRALGRRVWSVRPRLRHFDLVLVQREAFFLFNAWAEWIAHLQAPLVLDFDDAIWIHAISDANRRFKWLKNVDKIEQSVRLAKTVIAGNDYLAEWALQHNPATTMIPTCVDTDRYRPASRPPCETSGVVTIGWCGSPSTVAHFRLILPALARVRQRFGPRVRFRLMGDPRFRYSELELQGEAWNSEAELSFLRSMDIGIMPLPEDEWSKGKCGLKGLTSMACGAATVLSPVGVNTRIVEHERNGLLARSTEEWFQALCRLIEDEPFRRKLAAAGRETVVSRYSVRRWRDPFYRTLSAASQARGE